MTKPSMDYLCDQLKLLKGAKIVDVFAEEDEYEDWQDPWPFIVVDLAKDIVDKESGKQIRATLMIAQDEECNGPGVIMGLHEVKDMIDG